MTEKNENCGIEKQSENEKNDENKNEKNDENVSPICQKNCRVCSSGFVKEIHDMIKAGRKYLEICDYLKEKHNFSISHSSISRHIKNYKKHVQLISTEIMNTEIIEEATKQSEHTTKVITLIDIALGQLKANADAGNLQVDISDLEKLMKLRYQILSGDAGEDGELMAIFQKSIDKYGVNMNQGVLFKSKVTKD
ncbi:MAG TPA: hypothetical protein ENH35_05770 [Candidatus Moranbacteria bacterium]|nr:hypothetical protein [Candidatus Moranbacteria bacterium]